MVQKTSKWPITIRIGYEWTDRQHDPKVAPPADRYNFIKREIASVAKEVEKRVATRKGVNAYCVQIGRMRAMHGTELLPRFKELCCKTDIIAFDITGENPNVMLELGMALGAKTATSGRIFIFKQETKSQCDIPSDLKGYFITYFRNNDNKKKTGELELTDSPGFKAALRTTMIDFAREREMWGECGLVDEEANQKNKYEL